MNSQVRVATVAVSAQTIANAGRNVTILWMVVAGLAGLLALDGCGHAHGVEHADPNAASAESSSGKAPNSTPPADHPVRASKTEAHAEPASDTKTAAPSEVPLSSSPSGLLQSGAAKQIQERLAALGFLDDEKTSGAIDDSTGAALRKFQQSRDLAATGTPDQETVRKLDLDPKQIFRAASAP